MKRKTDEKMLFSNARRFAPDAKGFCLRKKRYVSFGDAIIKRA